MSHRNAQRAVQSSFQLAGLLFLGLVLSSSASAQSVKLASGEVEIGRGQPAQWVLAKAGDPLQAGDRVRTGAEGRAELLLRGATVRLYPNSLMRLPENKGAEDASSVALERGNSIFDVLKRKGNALFEVRTPEVVVSVKGTRFSVDSERSAVAVYRGSVGVSALTRAEIQELIVREGFATQLAEGPMEVVLNPIEDPWPAWSKGTPLPAHPDSAALPQLQRERGAIHEARKAAAAVSRPQALQAAMKKNPELRERIAEVITQRAKGAAQPPASLRGRDPVADSDSRSLRKQLRQGFLSEAFNPGGGGGAAGGGFFAVAPDSTGTGVEITFGGQLFPLSFAELSMVSQGSASLPTPVSAYLINQGFTEQQAAHLILNMIGSQ